MSKGACCQSRNSEFSPHGGRKKLNPASFPLTLYARAPSPTTTLNEMFLKRKAVTIDTAPTVFTNIKSAWSVDLNVKHRLMKLLQEKIKEGRQSWSFQIQHQRRVPTKKEVTCWTSRRWPFLHLERHCPSRGQKEEAQSGGRCQVVVPSRPASGAFGMGATCYQAPGHAVAESRDLP